MKKQHKWNFFGAGGFYQANIESGADIANIGSLDQTLWAALACPTKGLCFNQRMLELLDTDGDGRVRSPEVIAACEWICSMLKNPDKLVKDEDAVKVSDINTSTQEGAVLANLAKGILKNLGKTENDALTTSDFLDSQKLFADSIFNADSIICEEASSNENVKLAMRTIMDTIAESMDRSGKAGVSEDSIKEFYERLNAFLAWKSKEKDVSIFGQETESLYADFLKIKDKLNEYFEFSKVVSYDLAFEKVINASSEKFEKIYVGENFVSDFAKLPLALVHGTLSLDLNASVNPVYAQDFENFKTTVVKKICGDVKELSLQNWVKIKDSFAPYSMWLDAKDDRGISAIDTDVLEKIAPKEILDELNILIEKDKAEKDLVDSISKLEKLIYFNCYIHDFLNNFVSFKAFYKCEGNAMFQIGKLFFDQRECDLCIHADDDSKHSLLAASSYMYLIYCTCTRAGQAPIAIASAMTSGDSDNIIVGRNGIFYDRQGLDWDATVTKVVVNPISVRQAFWSPYKRAVVWISEHIAKRASSADSTVGENLQAENLKKKIDVGTVAALGVAFGGITAAFGMLLNAIAGIALWEFPLLILGIILLISLPSVVIASMKLRMRNLGPLLDANSWAVNSQAKLNFKLGSLLTRSAKIPFGSKHVPDKFAEKKSPFKILLIAILIGIVTVCAIEYKYSFIQKFVESKCTETTSAPATPAPEATPSAQS